MDSSMLSEPGPSRPSAQGRAASIAVQPHSAAAAAPASARQHRGSHQVPSTNGQHNNNNNNGQQAQDSSPQQALAPRDVYAHPAAVAYAQAHPRRTIPRFGPYLLLQTLGEGEFGKVKLGLHSQWGEEVAVKLIRRNNIDSNTRMVKVEREIEVLRHLKHPNIVRLYDVIETDKYIGIILEYASGGELFDHILAHRYLREKDAAKLFAQLISGVWYIHQKKIVHRDLKLENLLLDRHRNVIITDFGFANRFEAKGDDMMQTSCGSPCYAAPELVISEGEYVGTAVDIWSCGVILYAMLAGYLPFDDDPANPEGDNINLLYKYIVNTPLSFPDYISEEARDLLRVMLVPEPADRGSLEQVMAHRWLSPYRHLFGKTVDDLERAALEQQTAKRLAYQQSVKKTQRDEDAAKMSRSQSARPETFAVASPEAGRSRSQNATAGMMASQTQPEVVYDTSMEATPHRGHQSTMVLPTTHTSPKYSLDDDPFGPTSAGARAQAPPQIMEPAVEVASVPTIQTPAENPSPEKKKRTDVQRHTIQVEVGEPNSRSERQQQQQQRKASADKTLPSVPPGTQPGVVPIAATSSSRHRERGPPPSAMVPVQAAESPAQEVVAPPVVNITPTSPGPAAPAADANVHPSRQSSHKRGMSVDKPSIGKIFGVGNSNGNGSGKTGSTSQGFETSPAASRVPSETSASVPQESEDERTWYRKPSHRGSRDSGLPSQQQQPGTGTGQKPSWYGKKSSTAGPPPSSINLPEGNLSPSQAQSSISSKKSRRNTLTVMVEPLRNSLRGRRKEVPTPTTEKREADLIPAPAPGTAHQAHQGASQGMSQAEIPGTPFIPPNTPGAMPPGSTKKAQNVMKWFRSRSKGPSGGSGAGGQGTDMDVDTPITPTVVVQSPMSPGTAAPGQGQGQERPRRPSRPSKPSALNPPSTPSTTRSLTERFRGSLTIGVPSSMRKPTPTSKPSGSTSGEDRLAAMHTHQGSTNANMLTSQKPTEVIAHMKVVLEGLGLHVQQETDWRYRCTRPKKQGGQPAGGIAAFKMSGSAGSNGVDRRGLPQPANSFSGGMLRDLLMRRQSSQVSSNVVSPDVTPGGAGGELSDENVFFGPAGSGDTGEEIRFTVELTRMVGLTELYSLDIRRLKGGLPSFKVLYELIAERAALQDSTTNGQPNAAM